MNPTTKASTIITPEELAGRIDIQMGRIGLDMGTDQMSRFVRKALQGCSGITLGATTPISVLDPNPEHTNFEDSMAEAEEQSKRETDPSPSFTALGSQIGGSHYKDAKIQHVEFCQINQLTWCESSAMKYLMRHRKKNKVQDVDKAIHYCLLLREIEYPEAPPIDLPIGQKS